MNETHEAVEKLRQGDTAAFDWLFHRYSRELYYYAFALAQDSELAEDVVQETFIALWKHRGKLDPRLSLQSYLRMTIRNKVLNHIRHNAVRRRREEDIIRELSQQSTAGEEDWAGKLAVVRSFIETLPENCRKIFVMAVIDGTDYSKTASTLGISVNTVKSQVKIAYRKLRSNAANIEETDITALFLIFFFKNFM